jgi:DNA invertase Pin-like site-specific DNA recombinase
MRIGYARVSTHEQSLDLQKDALKKAGCKKIFVDQVRGIAAARPGIDGALSHLRKGDTLVVWRLERLGRSLKHLIELITRLEEMKVGFQSLQESIDTTNIGGKLVFPLFGALAEFERGLIRERTKAGLTAGRARGRLGGRPKALDKKKRRSVVQLYNERNSTAKEICEMMNISRQTLYSHFREDKSTELIAYCRINYGALCQPK